MSRFCAEKKLNKCLISIDFYIMHIFICGLSLPVNLYITVYHLQSTFRPKPLLYEISQAEPRTYIGYNIASGRSTVIYLLSFLPFFSEPFLRFAVLRTDSFIKKVEPFTNIMYVVHTYMHNAQPYLANALLSTVPKL
jgi:hypothetical protein